MAEILREIDLVLGFTQDRTRQDFDEDPMFQRAILHSMIIIGEAAAHLSADFQDQYSNVPWRDIKAMRNQLVHSYFSVDLNIVWQTAAIDLRPLKTMIEEILNQ